MDALELPWKGGVDHFKLGISELRELQKKCDAGPEWIYNRLATGQYLLEDAHEPIRLGLIGGGLSPDNARKIIQKYVEDEPLKPFAITAQVILAHAIFGLEDDPVGESEAGAAENMTTLSREENIDGQGSMKRA